VNDVDKTHSVTEEARPRLPRGVRLVHNEAQGGFVLRILTDVTKLLGSLADKRLLEL